MPFVSKAQQGYFNANKAAMERKGVNVNEWNKASKGLKLPRKRKMVPLSSMMKPKAAAW